MGAASRRAALALLFLVVAALPARAGRPLFREAAQYSGLDYRHGYDARILGMPRSIAGGVACGDFDQDGWPDLFVVCGAAGPSKLFRNLHDGTFADVAAAAGVARDDSLATGPLFFDYDGDGWPDLFVGAVEDGGLRLYHNRRDGTFEDVTTASGILPAFDTMGASAGDYDGDGRLDLFLARWGSPPGSCHLWRNLGSGRFACADASAGLDSLVRRPTDFTFTGNFADIDGDERQDLLVSSDFGTSRVFLQDASGRFDDATGPEITDENGMGAAVGDIDGDGDLDWFVSSVWDPDGIAEGGWGLSGNRLYRNRGDGTFEDATDAAGVRHGYWGWGATFTDLDLDGALDLVHVNGWPSGSPEFHFDPSRMFAGDGHGGFVDRSTEWDFADSAQGRGIVAFDYDRDGDIDLFIANHGARPALWINMGAIGRWLSVELVGRGENPGAVGARIELTVNGVTQVRLVRAGTNFMSQDPLEAHFGLGQAVRAERLLVLWPDGTRSTLEGVAADQRVVVVEPAPTFGASGMAARPNPFMSAVDVRLAVPAAHATTAFVHDVSGRVVRTFAVEAGEQRVTWDGRSDQGTGVPAGIYWVRMAGAGGPGMRLVRLR